MTPKKKLRIPVFSRLAEDMKAVWLLWPYFRELKPFLILSAVLGLLSAIIESVAIGLVILFILKTIKPDMAMPGNPVVSSFIQSIESITHGQNLLVWAIILAILLVKSLIVGAYNYLSAYLINMIHHKLRVALFNKYITLNYRDLARMDYGAMANTLQIESWYAVEVVKSFSSILISACAVFAYLGVIFVFFSKAMAVIAIALGIVMKLALSILKQPLREKGHIATRAHESLSSRMYTRMQALKSIRAHGLEDREIKSFSDASLHMAKTFTSLSVIDLYLKPAYDICLVGAIAFLVWYSGYAGNPATVTATVIALLYKLRLYIFGIEDSLAVIIRSQGPLNAIMKQLSIKGLLADPANAQAPSPDWKTLRFEHVSFSYDDTNPVIENLSFDLNRGDVLAIGGLSGAGKSTLVNLILKLVEPTGGNITLDGKGFGSIARIPWLSQLAAAGQDFDLIDGTLKENLTFGRDFIDDKTIRDALEIAEIQDFVDDLPEGLETRIGERGVRLSGGQRQRIILARALAARPALLILDEATSAVSLDVEERIHQNIRTRHPDMTIILITHRTLKENFASREIKIGTAPSVVTMDKKNCA